MILLNKDRSQRGAAAVEFAILAVLLLVFVFGIIEFGFLWVQSHYIANSSREGARVASKLENPAGDDLTKVREAVQDYLRGVLFYSDALVDDCCGTSDFLYIEVTPATVVDTDDSIRVTVSVQTDQVWEPVLWDLLALIPGLDLGEIRRVTETAVFPKT